MSKLYFEMNDAEKVLNHIQHDLEWADCLLAEGILAADQPIRIGDEEFRRISNEISDLIHEVGERVCILLKAVEDRYDEQIPDFMNEDAEGDTNDMKDEIMMYLRMANEEDLREISGMTRYCDNEVHGDNDEVIGVDHMYCNHIDLEGTENFNLKHLYVFHDGRIMTEDISAEEDNHE